MTSVIKFKIGLKVLKRYNINKFKVQNSKVKIKLRNRALFEDLYFAL